MADTDQMFSEIADSPTGRHTMLHIYRAREARMSL